MRKSAILARARDQAIMHIREAESGLHHINPSLKLFAVFCFRVIRDTDVRQVAIRPLYVDVKPFVRSLAKQLSARFLLHESLNPV